MLADLEARFEERLTLSERRTVWLEAALFRLLQPNYSSGQPSLVNGNGTCRCGEDEVYVGPETQRNAECSSIDASHP